MSHYSSASLGPLDRPPSSEAILIFQRSRDRLRIVCPVMFSGALFIGEGLIHNLSQTGCLVECHRRMLEGSYMAVRLLLPDTTHALIIELAAVRWIREEYFGIEFLKLPTSDQARLAHFLLAHQR
ncbi:MAG TPA: PilZ domain-containing protein [Nitrospira sp.]|nr:PilZ domain-containing protein [Nitrospira sp.]